MFLSVRGKSAGQGGGNFREDGAKGEAGHCEKDIGLPAFHADRIGKGDHGLGLRLGWLGCQVSLTLCRKAATMSIRPDISSDLPDTLSRIPAG